MVRALNSGRFSISGLVRTVLVGLTLVVTVASSSEPALSAGRSLVIYNAIRNVDVVSLKVRGGVVSGFKRLPPMKGVAVTVTTEDGKCAAWIVARIEDNSAANALVDTCHGGSYAVIVRPSQGTFGTSTDLNIIRVK